MAEQVRARGRAEVLGPAVLGHPGAHELLAGDAAERAGLDVAVGRGGGAGAALGSACSGNTTRPMSGASIAKRTAPQLQRPVSAGMPTCTNSRSWRSWPGSARGRRAAASRKEREGKDDEGDGGSHAAARRRESNRPSHPGRRR